MKMKIQTNKSQQSCVNILFLKVITAREGCCTLTQAFKHLTSTFNNIKYRVIQKSCLLIVKQRFFDSPCIITKTLI